MNDIMEAFRRMWNNPFEDTGWCEESGIRKAFWKCVDNVTDKAIVAFNEEPWFRGSIRKKVLRTMGKDAQDIRLRYLASERLERLRRKVRKMVTRILYDSIVRVLSDDVLKAEIRWQDYIEWEDK